MSATLSQSSHTDEGRQPRGWRSHQVLMSCALAAGLTFSLVRLSPSPANEGNSAGAIATLARTSAPAVIDDGAIAAPQAVSGEIAVEFCRLLLSDAQRRLSEVDTMSALFLKRERIGGELQELNVMEMKARRSPSSVYLRWREPDEGREIIWREDTENAQILLHPGGWRRKLVPLLKIDPEGDQAMQYSRRPVSSAGIWSFTARITEMLEKELVADPLVKVSLDHAATIGEHHCYCFEFAHAAPSPSAKFARVAIYVERHSKIPVAIERYNWADDASQTEPLLEESYVFHDLVLGAPLSELAFSVDNPDYQYNGR